MKSAVCERFYAENRSREIHVRHRVAAYSQRRAQAPHHADTPYHSAVVRTTVYFRAVCCPVESWPALRVDASGDGDMVQNRLQRIFRSPLARPAEIPCACLPYPAQLLHDGLNMYVTGAMTSTRAVILCYDVYGANSAKKNYWRRAPPPSPPQLLCSSPVIV